MKSCEGIGKTVEKAIEDALIKLDAKREDVDIKILEEGGLFKKAKVLLTVSEDFLNSNTKNEIKELIKSKKQDENIDIYENGIKEIINDKENEDKNEIEVNLSKKDINKKITTIDFIKEILKILNIECNVEEIKNNDVTQIKLTGGNSGNLIGYRGECLNAIQYIATIIESENTGKKSRVIIDIENYRRKREDSLKALARRMENKVIKTNKSMKLEPMNANERRIIHTELQNSELVTTISKGTEPNRYVVILKKSDKIEKNNE